MFRRIHLLLLALSLTLTVHCSDADDEDQTPDIFTPSPVNVTGTATSSAGTTSAGTTDHSDGHDGADGHDQATTAGTPGDDGMMTGPGTGEDSTDESADGTDGTATASDATDGCEPKCSGKQCGNDGCGGECGQCEAGYECNSDDQCQPNGFVCNAPIAVKSLPFSISGSTQNAVNSTQCNDAETSGANANDVVYQFVPTIDGKYQFSVDANYKALVHVSPECGGEKCLGEASAMLVVDLQADQAYTIAVDGAEKDAYGDYNLLIDDCANPCQPGTCGDGKCGLPCECNALKVCDNGKCVDPALGDTCSGKPITVNQLPFESKSNTAVHTNAVTCTGGPGDGVDVVHVYNPPFDGRIAVELKADFSAFAYLTETCDAGKCGTIVPPANTIGYSTKANHDYYVVVEATHESAKGSFSLTIRDCPDTACDEECPCPSGEFCTDEKLCKPIDQSKLCTSNPEKACEGQPCNAMPCGSPCGCPEEEVCNGGVCSAPVNTDTCSKATEITGTPAQISGSLAENGDFAWCNDMIGAGSDDAFYKFTAPSTGVFVASVQGSGKPIVFRSHSCTSGPLDCQGTGGPAITFLQHKKAASWLVVDAHTEEGAEFHLSLTRVLGLKGSLGSACNSQADCTYADECVAGICTLSCDPSGADNACIGAVDGPRGKDFGCAADAKICVPGIKNGDNAMCNSNEDCSSNECAGFWGQPPTKVLKGICAPKGDLLDTGSECKKDSECASSLCLEGACKKLCQSNNQCNQSELCLFVPLEDKSTGACSTVIVSKTPCTTDSECPDTTRCEGLLLVGGKPMFFCKSYDANLAALGEPCMKHSDCQSGLCPFQGFKGFVPSVCSAVCPSVDDCPKEYQCLDFSIWNAGTKTDSSDDATLPICLSGAAGSTCLVNGKPLCTTDLKCTDVFDGYYGACQ